MVTILLLIHAFVAVALLGALTHQTLSSAWPATANTGSFFSKFRATRPVVYTNAIVLLYVLEVVLGSLMYPSYRINVRMVLEDLKLTAPTGIFEIKEHYAALGLGMLPAYWYYWKKPIVEHTSTQTWLSAILCFTVYYNFLIGHILNNMRGFGL